MKIGILTQPLRTNYGGILQNYALQRALKELGHNPVTIDRAPMKYKRNVRWGLVLIKRTIFKLLRIKLNSHKYINPEKQVKLECEAHLNFINKYINIIRVPYPLKSDITMKENFEGFVVGSDQVWRLRYNTPDSIKCFYLSFTEEQNVKKIAYAASFGQDNLNEYSDELIKSCSYLANKFNDISVREDSAVRLCKEYFTVDATHVLDPTMLFTAEQYREILTPKDYMMDGEVAVYILDLTEEKRVVVNNICSKLGKKPYFINNSKNGVHRSIESWIAAFDKAEYVITDSFHGSVFSIIFGKQFNIILNSGRGLSRFSSLTNMLGIKDNIVNNNDFNLSEINYSEVHNILNAKRQMSLGFLINSLKN